MFMNVGIYEPSSIPVRNQKFFWVGLIGIEEIEAKDVLMINQFEVTRT